MIIDCHLHLQDDVYVGIEGTPENIIGMMDKAGVDKSVVFKIWVSTESSIEAGEEASRKYPSRLIPFVYAVPDYREPVIKIIEKALVEKKFRGIKIHAGDCRLERYIIDPVIELAGKLNVPCLIDPAGNYGAMKRLASTFPEVKIIIAHLGKYLCKEGEIIERFISMAEEHDNIFLDVSGVVLLDKIEDAVKRIGSKRIFWGTDGPRKDPDTVSFTKREIKKIQNLNLSDSQKQDVLGRGIACLLGIR